MHLGSGLRGFVLSTAFKCMAPGCMLGSGVAGFALNLTVQNLRSLAFQLVGTLLWAAHPGEPQLPLA